MKLLLYAVMIFSFYSLQADDVSSLLFNGNCITCHKETKSISAPSVVKFKSVYINAFPVKEDFVDYMSNWVLDPKEESSLMQGAVKKHGLMPHMAYDLETLKNISAYIYETDFTKRGGRYWRK